MPRVEQVASLLAHDMVGKHAGRMHGVPSTYNWAKHPRVGVGNHPARHGFHAISAWGQIYEDINGSPARNVRVACRDISLWILSRRTGKWRHANASRRVNGANYVEDFNGNASKPADLRQEPHGAISATLGGGYNFHLFAIRARAAIDPSDVAGVVCVYSARVIMDDPNGPTSGTWRVPGQRRRRLLARPVRRRRPGTWPTSASARPATSTRLAHADHVDAVAAQAQGPAAICLRGRG